ncbi:MAG: DUF1080 domain-containing protein, partial [Planctomycetaceae bacterium]|nr:DUF1080 domain-containing protein [Planctomycetaceae bacterium]
MKFWLNLLSARMALSLTEFCKQLTDTDLVAEDDLARCQQKCESAGSDEERVKLLAKVLVKEKLLTLFQVQQVYAGKVQTLFLGSYVIEDKLGEGGMGMVFKARHQHMDRHVAIKVLSPKLTKNADLLKRFRREVKALAALSHGNIVIAYDAGEARGIHFLAMQYVEGTDLSSLVKSRGPLSVNRTLDYMIQAGRGLQYAHERSIIHRDVKPANMLLDAEGVVRILDMGLASFETEDVEKQSQLTATGQVMGTVDFMAPEQALNTRDADARSDIYSLGCSVYYLLTGKAIYNGDTQLSRLMAHQSQPIPLLPPKVLQQSPQLDAVYRKLVAKQPQDRYQSMAEALAALESCRSSELPPPAAGSVVIPPHPDGPGDSTQLNNFLQNLEAEAKAGQSTAAPDATVIATRTTDPEETFIGTSVEEPTNATGQFSIGPADVNRTRATEATRVAGVPAVRKQQSKANSPAAPKSLGVDEVAAPPKPATIGSRRKRGGRSGRGVPKFTLIGAGCLGLLILLGIIIRIKNKDGSITEIKVPDTATVEIVRESSPPAAANPVGTTPTEMASSGTPAAAEAGREPWIMLFDGKDTSHWQTLGPFKVHDGLLVADGGGANATSNEQFEDFELEAEWKIGPQGNGGIYYREPPNTAITAGNEYQILDDAAYTDKQPPNMQTGALYGLIEPATAASNPIGEWNTTRIVCDGTRAEHWLNGKHLLTYDTAADAWKELMAESSFGGKASVGTRPSGHILLQGHTGEVAFRNIRIRRLSAGSPTSAADLPAGGGLQFDGVDDYVVVPSLEFPELPFTLEAWVTFADPSNTPSVTERQRDGQTIVGWQFAARLMSHFDDERGRSLWGQVHEPGTNTVPSAWRVIPLLHDIQHVAIVADIDTVKLFLDGVALAEKSHGKLHSATSNWSDFVIGAGGDSKKMGSFFKGTVHAVRLSRGIRYAEDFTPLNNFIPDADTIACYDFSQGSGDVLKDVSGNGHDGKIIGATWVAPLSSGLGLLFSRPSNRLEVRGLPIS